MAKNTALTPLGVAALGLLAERPMHPYEMYQLLMHRSDDRLIKVRPGTLYHTVGRLEEHGLVVADGTGRDGNRPERTTYSLTEAGETALRGRLREMLAVPVNEFPCFPLAIAEAHNLPAAEVVDLLEQRVQALAAQLDFLAAGVARVEAKNIDAKYWVDVTYQQRILQCEIDWITALRTDISSGALPW